MSRVTWLCCVFIVCCGVSPVFAEPRNPGLPLTTSLRGPEAVHAGDTITVRLDIVRSPDYSGMLLIHLVIPPGARLVEGLVEETTLDTTPLQVRSYRLRILEVPPTDMVARVELRAEHWGTMADANYRFGRPEPNVPPPRAGRSRSEGVANQAM